MTLEDFALRHQLRVRKDSCGDLIVPGRKPKDGTIRFEDHQHVCDLHRSDGLLGLYLWYPTKNRWNNAKKKLGLVPKQDGDADGILLFDPTDEKTVRTIIKLAGIRIRKILDPIKAAAVIARLKKVTAS